MLWENFRRLEELNPHGHVIEGDVLSLAPPFFALCRLHDLGNISLLHTHGVQLTQA